MSCFSAQSRVFVLTFLSSIPLGIALEAADSTWTGDTDATWAAGTNWDSGTAPGAGDRALFTGDGNGNLTLDLGAGGVTLSSLEFDTANAAAFTIGSGGAGSQTLTLDTAALDVIRIDATVTTSQAFDANLALSASGAYTVTHDGSGTLSFNGVISGVGGLTKSGSGLVVLGANNTYTGGTTISEGVLQVGTGSSGLITGAIVNNAEMVLNWNVPTLSDFSMSGTGLLTKNGSGAVIIRDALTHTGGTTINAGELVIGFNGTTGSLAGDVTNNGTLTFYRSDDLTYAGIISGTGGLKKDGAGTLTLSAAQSYTGDTTISAGTLRISSALALQSTTVQINSNAELDLNGFSATLGGLRGTGNLAIPDGATLTVGAADGSLHNYSGVLSGTGSQLIKNGTGTLILSGANTYDGGTTIHAGTLQIGFNSSGSVVGNITNHSALVFNRNATYSFDGAIEGSGSVTQKTGQLTLSGTNTYSGGTTLQNGTLTLGSAGAIGTSGTITFTGGTLKFSAENTADYSARFSTEAGQSYEFDTNGQNVTLASDLASSGASLTKSGDGILTLAGSNTFEGGTFLSGGTLSLGSSGALGTSGTIRFYGGTLQFSASNQTDYSGRFNLGSNQPFKIDTNGQDVTFASALSSTGGSLTKSGDGTLTLAGANTYTGSTTLAGGTLALGHGSALGGSGTITFSGGTLQYSASNTTDYSARFNTTSNQSYAIDTNGQNVTLATALTSTGGSLTKSGAGTLTLTGSNTYDGGTTVSGGILQVGSGTTGTLSGNVQIDAGATLRLSRSNAATFNLSSTGEGSLAKIGSGTIYLLSDLSHTGGTTISSGNLTIGNGGTTGSLAGDVVNNASMSFYRSDDITFGGTISGTGTIQQRGTGILTLSAANTFSGSTYISGGTVRIGDALALQNSTVDIGVSGTLDLNGLDATLGALTGPGDLGIAENATLTVGGNNLSTSYAGTLSGTGASLVKNGTGTLILSAQNTHSGDTTVNGGTIRIGHANALQNSTVAIEVDGGLDLGGYDATLGGLAGASDLAIPSNRTLTVGGNNASTTFSGDLSGSGASLVKTGTGTLTLSGNNSYDGGTTLLEGTLAFGGNLDLAEITFSAGTVEAQGTLTGLGMTLPSGKTIRVNGSGATALLVGETLALDGGRLEIQNGASAVPLAGGTVAFDATNGGSIGMDGGTLNIASMGIALSLNPAALIEGHGTIYGAVDLGSGGTIDGDATGLQLFGSLSGSGTVSDLTVFGTISPGHSPGIMAVDGDLSLTSGSITEMEVAGGGGVAGVDFDQISTSGTLTLGGTLAISLLGGYTLEDGGAYALFEAGAFAGDFTQVTISGVELTQQGNEWRTTDGALAYSFHSGAGLLSVSAVPEPASFAALLGALLALGIGIRRRKTKIRTSGAPSQ